MQTFTENPGQTLMGNGCILIVEDDKEIREELAEILTNDGYQTTSVGTFAAAKEKLRQNLFDILLVDINLPDGSGLELLREAKDTEINQNISVMILTAFASLENSIIALNEGAAAYFRKPLNPTEIRDSIRETLKKQKQQVLNRNLVDRLTELSLKDMQTELYNYRYLLERLRVELFRAKRYTLPLSLLMLDIDYFKSVNDTYGHPYGDMILKEFAQCLKIFARASDVVVRYGGEEFVALLTDTDKESAVEFGRRLLSAIDHHVFDPERRRLQLKISMGISNFPEDCTEAGTALNMIDFADQALSTAKESGGNRLSTYNGSRKRAEAMTEGNGQKSIEKLTKKITQMTSRTNRTLLESLNAVAKTIEMKDSYSTEHIANTVSIIVEIGKKMKLSQRMLEALKNAAVLYDIGKIGIPNHILCKKTKLSPEEYELIKQHPRIAAKILQPIPFLKTSIPLILYHHERVDGSGYPSGLHGTEIPLGARIIGLVDVYQALISDRYYRKAHQKDDALRTIENGIGTLFDPAVGKIFLEVVA